MYSFHLGSKTTELEVKMHPKEVILYFFQILSPILKQVSSHEEVLNSCNINLIFLNLQKNPLKNEIFYCSPFSQALINFKLTKI